MLIKPKFTKILHSANKEIEHFKQPEIKNHLNKNFTKYCVSNLNINYIVYSLHYKHLYILENALFGWSKCKYINKPLVKVTDLLLSIHSTKVY